MTTPMKYWMKARSEGPKLPYLGHHHAHYCLRNMRKVISRLLLIFRRYYPFVIILALLAIFRCIPIWNKFVARAVE